MANELTIDTVATPYVSQVQDQGIVKYSFTGIAANGTATTVRAAGATGTKHIVTHLRVSVDTAGETLAIGGPKRTITLYLPVAEFYQYTFDPPLECEAATALTLDKGTVAGVSGELHMIPAAANGVPVKV